MKTKKLTYCGIPTTVLSKKLTNGFRLHIRRENFNDIKVCKGDARKGTLVHTIDRELTYEEINLTNEELVAKFS